MSNKRLRKLSGAVIGGLLIGGGMAGFGASNANANLTLDLAFADGSNLMTLTSANLNGGTDFSNQIPINVYATVTGTTATQGFSFAFFNVVNSQVNGGAVKAGPADPTYAGPVAGVPPTSGGISYSSQVAGISDNGGSVGTYQYLGPSGLMDIGSTQGIPNNQTSDNSSFIARAPFYTYVTGSPPITVKHTATAPSTYSVQNNGTAVAGGYRWLIGTLYYDVAALNPSPTSSSKTVVSIALPSTLNGSPPAAQWFQDPTTLDGVNGAVTSTAANYLAGNSVSFVLNAPVANSSVSLAAGNSGTSGTVSVSGSGGNYNSNKLTVNSSSGSVNIVSSPGDMSEGHVYVAAWMSQQSAGQIAALISELQGQGMSILTSGTTFNNITNQFGSAPSAVFDFAALGGNKVFSWNFTGADAGVQVSQLAVVPEPASIGLLALGAVGLLARRRRRA